MGGGRASYPLKTLQAHTPKPLEAVLPQSQFPSMGVYAAVTGYLLKNEGWPIHSKLTGDLGHG